MAIKGKHSPGEFGSNIPILNIKTFSSVNQAGRIFSIGMAPSPFSTLSPRAPPIPYTPQVPDVTPSLKSQGLSKPLKTESQCLSLLMPKHLPVLCFQTRKEGIPSQDSRHSSLRYRVSSSDKFPVVEGCTRCDSQAPRGRNANTIELTKPELPCLKCLNYTVALGTLRRATASSLSLLARLGHQDACFGNH